jgi:hypothetical protein
MTNETQEEKRSKFEQAIGGHDLEDLERILLVNDRKSMDPLFYSFVSEKIRQKKKNPVVFIKYNRDFIIAIIALIVSVIALFKE